MNIQQVLDASNISSNPVNTLNKRPGYNEEDDAIHRSVIKIEMFPDGGYKKHQSALARTLRDMAMGCNFDQFETTLLQLTWLCKTCLLYTSPSPRDQRGSRMPSSA